MQVAGIVIKGREKGRKLGFPTANVKIPSDVIIETGIYAGMVRLDGKEYGSAIYVAGNGIIEAFLFDFEKDIYGQKLKIDIIKKIRGKKEFENDQEAIGQIAIDILEIKKCLQELSGK